VLRQEVAGHGVAGKLGSGHGAEEGTGTPLGKLGSGHGHSKGGLRPWRWREDGNGDAAGDDGAGRRSARAQSAAGGPVLTERTRGLNVVHISYLTMGRI